MISVIICSIDDMKSARIQAHYHALLIGHPHEIIMIRDAKSLCEGYNRGFAQSSGETIIFSHDDIEVLSDDFAARLLRHLDAHHVVGVAGTSRLTGPSWYHCGQPNIHGCITHPRSGTFSFESFGSPSAKVQAIDGVFMAARREVVNAIPFDSETFDGFHLYDLDFSYRAHLAGFRIVVPWDIMMLHSGAGNMDAVWHHYAARFVAKHRDRLSGLKPGEPICAQTNLPSIEAVKIRHRRMVANATPAFEMHEATVPVTADPLDPRWQSALLGLPPVLPRSAWLGHIPFLAMLFDLMRPTRYVELGVDLGASFLAACESSRRADTCAHCMGIDTWQGDLHAGMRDGSK
ncbi:MAG: glycosyltransferase, partial [Acetobacteraceae bacterium]